MRRLIAVFLITALLSGCGGLRGNSRSYRMEKETNYLASQSEPISLQNVEAVSKLFTKEIASKNIVLTGEVPGVSGNAELEKFFFDAVNDIRKVDYLIAEIPYSAGELLNRYLRSGEEKDLDKVFNALRGRPYATEENRSFYRQLRLTLNETDQSLRVIGVDMEYAPELSMQFLADLLVKHKTQDFPLAGELVEARNKNFMQPDYLKVTYASLLKNIKADEAKAASAFGTDYDAIKHVLENLQVVYDEVETTSNEQFDHDRSDQLVANFLSVYDQNPNAMYFGQLSNPAVMQSEHLNYDWFASAIQIERDKAKNKVMSLLYTYENCQRMVQVEGRAEKEKLDLFKFDNKTMLSAVDQPYTIISLIEEDTMFHEDSVIFEKDFAGAVTDYIQYIVVLNESPAAKALK